MTVDQAEETLARVHLSAALEPGQPVLLEAVRAVGALVVVDRLRRGDSILDADGRNGRRLGEVDPRAVLDRSTPTMMSFMGCSSCPFGDGSQRGRWCVRCFRRAVTTVSPIRWPA